MEEVKNMIYSVLHTMDRISVVGHENMDKLLGCYQYLEKSVQMLEDLEREAEMKTATPPDTAED